MESPDGKVLQAATSGAPVVFAFEFENRNCDHKDSVSFSFSVHTDREFGLFHYYSHFSDTYFKNLPLTGSFKCLIPEFPLAPGNYLVMCRAVMNGDQTTGEEADWPRVFVPITVVGGDFYGTGNVNLSKWAPYPGQRHLVYGGGEDPEKIYRELSFGGGGTEKAPENFFALALSITGPEQLRKPYPILIKYLL